MIDEMRTALSLDPLSSIVNTNYALVLYASQALCRIGGAISKVLERDPTFPPAYNKMSKHYANMGRFPDAVKTLRTTFFTKPY